ncbi:uncharacterized protein LOC125945647 [Dermacentor silvarum]|uniref:uncharacterized protein LOC125945647 n=1 Tax=Dermacentor silvarum TaxID=543639 RepID=UPI0021006C40|nr:uncharacterized protein LOC125945647 [Dermacentor silvarum]
MSKTRTSIGPGMNLRDAEDSSGSRQQAASHVIEAPVRICANKSTLNKKAQIPSESPTGWATVRMDNDLEENKITKEVRMRTCASKSTSDKEAQIPLQSPTDWAKVRIANGLEEYEASNETLTHSSGVPLAVVTSGLTKFEDHRDNSPREKVSLIVCIPEDPIGPIAMNVSTDVLTNETNPDSSPQEVILPLGFHEGQIGQDARMSADALAKETSTKSKEEICDLQCESHCQSALSDDVRILGLGKCRLGKALTTSHDDSAKQPTGESHNVISRRSAHWLGMVTFESIQHLSQIIQGPSRMHFTGCSKLAPVLSCQTQKRRAVRPIWDGIT